MATFRRCKIITTLCMCIACTYSHAPVLGEYSPGDDFMEVFGKDDLSEDVFEMNHDKLDGEEFHFNVDLLDGLHRAASKFNRKENERRKGLRRKAVIAQIDTQTERNRFNEYDLNDWIVGFRSKNPQPEEMNNNQKRETLFNSSDYNYDVLKKDYDDQVNRMAGMERPQNKAKGAIKEAVKKEPLVCKSGDRNGLFIKGLRCMFKDLSEGKISVAIFTKCMTRFIKFWLLVYIFIAIPCWCKYGWCFCYCRCRFCKPRFVINEAKRYVMQNPPGTLLGKNKDPITFKPTVMENYTYNNLHYAVKTV